MIPKRIDPHSLLNCLGVLLNTSGGIKSKEDVARIVSLMSKFSKKLVSKCVYVEILHATSDELLGVYMEDGGWELVSTWIKESVTSNNGPLLETLLTLTLKSDLSLPLLEINDCPKCVKNLTSIAPNERVKSLACEIVTCWIEVAKRGLQPADLEKVEAACKNSQIQLAPPEPIAVPIAMAQQDQPDDSKVLTIEEIEKEVSMEEDEEDAEAEEEELGDEEEEEEEEEEDGDEEEEAGADEDAASRPLGELPVFKITIRDGKQVLATVSSAKPSPVNIPAEEVKLEVKVEEPAADTIKAEPRGASRRKQQLKPVNEPMIMSETEKKRVAAQEKKSARIEKELEAKRNEKIFKEKNRKLKEKLADREAKQKALKQKEQEEKDKATLAKLMGTGNKVSLGKIPKKVKSDEGDKKGSSDSSRRSSADDDKKRKSESSKSSSSSSKDKKDTKSPSSSTRSSLANLQPVKHKVKTFNSKFRSTGLEEEPPLPPPRGQSKKDLKDEKSPSTSSSGKRSPPPIGKEQTPPEKKSKLDEVVKKVNDKTRSKPATQLLQESNFFMDALDAGVKNEPRKRKRRVSSSKEESPVPAKAPSKEPTSPAVDKKSDKSSASPTSVRPTFNFYTETLETSSKPDADAKETDNSENDNNSDSRTPTPPIEGTVEENSQSSELLEDVTKGVLVIHRSTRITDRVKKSVRFRSEEELVSVRYFELDETERVNVTKIGGDMNDMKMSDAAYERQMMCNSKKLDSSCEVIETDVPWRLTLIDCPPPLAELGKNSSEKIVQCEREKTVLQAIYFSPESIPDCPTEPEPEILSTAEPATIPQEDLTGNPDSVKDFSHLPWAEPKGMQPTPVATGGGWRTGDGQILSSNTQAPQFPPPNMPFSPGYETGNPVANMGYQTPNFNPQDMNGMNPHMNGMAPNMNGMNPNMNGINPNMMGMMNNMMMPGAPGFMQFPPNVNNFSAPPPGNWGPPMGPNGPGGFRGRGNHMMGRGGPGRGYFGPPRGGLRGMNRERSNPCKHFARGFCRNGQSCNFKH